MADENLNYKVGYKKPPVSGQFKKGQSGNSRGRPIKVKPQELDPSEVIRSIDNEEVVVKIGGKSRRMPKCELSVRHLFLNTMNRDLTSARLIAKMASEYFEYDDTECSKPEFIIIPDWLPTKTPETAIRLELDNNNLSKKRRGAKLGNQPQVSVGHIFRKVALEYIGIGGDNPKSITRWDAYVRQIYNMSITTNGASAARLINQLRKSLKGKMLPSKPPIFLIYPEDAKL